MTPLPKALHLPARELAPSPVVPRTRKQPVSTLAGLPTQEQEQLLVEDLLYALVGVSGQRVRLQDSGTYALEVLNRD